MTRWLTCAGPKVPAHIQDLLLCELFASPNAVLIGVANGLVLNMSAIVMHGGTLFIGLLLLDFVLAGVRTWVVRHAYWTASRGMRTPTDLALLTSIAWCSLQGVMAFSAMRTGIAPLQVLAATFIMALLGPLCARNYPAPRLALLLVVLSEGPFMAGAALSGERWLLLLLFEAPLLGVAALMIIGRFQTMAIATLLAQHENHDRARHDPLTGLLNRFGLAEVLSGLDEGAPRPFVLFYLDLDGFKQINDSHGHLAGDRLLHEVARRLRASTRGSDSVARLGGDEFVVVAYDMAPEEGGRFADSIIGRVASLPYEIEAAGTLHIGLSVGFACAPEDGTVLDDLRRKADAALYEVKASGKGIQRRFLGEPAY